MLSSLFIVRLHIHNNGMSNLDYDALAKAGPTTKLEGHDMITAVTQNGGVISSIRFHVFISSHFSLESAALDAVEGRGQY